ncbi:MAG TPA: hypothetical protein VIU39_03970 [Anaerolineales bacterium]
MKKLLRILRPAALLGLGLLLAVTSAAIGQPVITGNHLNTTSLAQPTPTPVPPSEVGSTDGLVMLSVIIVLIIAVPILIRRRSWSS